MASMTNILLGGLVGAAAGMLLAPRSGEDTRVAIKDIGKALRDQMGDSADSALSMASDMTKENRKMASKLTKQAKDRAAEVQRRGKAIKAILQGEDIPDQKSMAGTFISGILLGSIIGAAVGMIVAPRPGSETRAVLRDKGMQLKDQMSQTASTARDRAQQMADTTRNRAESLQQRGQQMVNEKKNEASHAASNMKAQAQQSARQM